MQLISIFIYFKFSCMSICSFNCIIHSKKPLHLNNKTGYFAFNIFWLNIKPEPQFSFLVKTIPPFILRARNLKEQFFFSFLFLCLSLIHWHHVNTQKQLWKRNSTHIPTFVLCKILLSAFNCSIYNVCHNNNLILYNK